MMRDGPANGGGYHIEHIMLLIAYSVRLQQTKPTVEIVIRELCQQPYVNVGVGGKPLMEKSAHCFPVGGPADCSRNIDPKDAACIALNPKP